MSFSAATWQTVYPQLVDALSEQPSDDSMFRLRAVIWLVKRMVNDDAAVIPQTAPLYKKLINCAAECDKDGRNEHNWVACKPDCSHCRTPSQLQELPLTSLLFVVCLAVVQATRLWLLAITLPRCRSRLAR